MGYFPLPSYSSWWLNQPIWKNIRKKRVHLPQIGMKIKKIFETTTQSCWRWYKLVIFHCHLIFPGGFRSFHRLIADCVLSPGFGPEGFWLGSSRLICWCHQHLLPFQSRGEGNKHTNTETQKSKTTRMGPGSSFFGGVTGVLTPMDDLINY